MRPLTRHPPFSPFIVSIALFACIIIHSATGLAYPHQSHTCLDGYGNLPGPTQDHRVSSATPKRTHNQGFVIEDHGSYKLVRVNATREVYCVHKSGSRPPAPSSLPSGTRVFSVPLTSLSVVDASSVAFMAELGVLHHIKYVTELASDPCMQKLALSTGRSGCGRKSWPAGSSLLKVQAAEVDAVWMDEGSTSSDTIPVNSIMFGARGEADPLGRAEWLEFAALFFGKEQYASQRLGDIVSSYRAVQRAAAPHVAGGGRRPRVAWAAATRKGEVELLLGGYEERLTKDAGGQAVELPEVTAAAAAAGALLRCRGPHTGHAHTGHAVADDVPCGALAAVAVLNTSSPAGASVLLQLLHKVDAVVDTTPWPAADSPPTAADLVAAYGLPSAAASTLPPVVSGRFYRPDARLTLHPSPAAPAMLDWLATAAMARPDLALQDLALALHPRAAASGAGPGLVFLRNTASPQRQQQQHGGAVREDASVLRPQQCLLLHGCTMQPQPRCPYVYRDAATGSLRYNTASPCSPAATATSLIVPAASAPTPAASGNSSASPAGASDNGAAALRPLLLVFFMIVALIEGLIHLF